MKHRVGTMNFVSFEAAKQELQRHYSFSEEDVWDKLRKGEIMIGPPDWGHQHEVDEHGVYMVVVP